MTFRLGLTGSIGMGKSTVAGMFAERGHPVWDADAAVHRLYAPGGAAVDPVAALFPTARDAAGGIDRAALRAALRDHPDGLAELEAAVHPLLAADRARFLSENRGRPIVVFDVPLLFETGGEGRMDGTAVVFTSADNQRARVMARPGMTEDHFRSLLSRQMPDAEKRARATWVIPTDTLAGSRAEVDRICKEIQNGA